MNQDQATLAYTWQLMREETAAYASETGDRYRAYGELRRAMIAAGDETWVIGQVGKAHVDLLSAYIGRSEAIQLIADDYRARLAVARLLARTLADIHAALEAVAGDGQATRDDIYAEMLAAMVAWHMGEDITPDGAEPSDIAIAAQAYIAGTWKAVIDAVHANRELDDVRALQWPYQLVEDVITETVSQALGDLKTIEIYEKECGNA